MRVISESFKENSRENSEKTRANREQVSTYNSYSSLLEEQRAKREATVRGQQG